MKLSEKITALRRIQGWSQEEFAARMGVSRQAVSKWESDANLPDVDKIIEMSTLFGVSTDVLLKSELPLDAVELSHRTEQEPEVPKGPVIPAEDVTAYVAERYVAAPFIALATMLCVLSPVLLFVFGGLLGFEHTATYVVGIAGVLSLVGIAVGIFINFSMRASAFSFHDEEVVCYLDATTRDFVKQKQEIYRISHQQANTIGGVLCVLSPIALIISSILERDKWLMLSLALLLIFVSFALFLFVLAGVKWACTQHLLGEGDYAAKEETNSIEDRVSKFFWPPVIAIYLLWSFLGGKWGDTWIIWPIAAVIYFVITSCIEAFTAGKKPKDDE